MKRKCKHENADHVFPGQTFSLWMADSPLWPVLAECLRCVVCGEWLSLGPSNDTDEQVQTEMRAAELVTGILASKDVMHREYFGWLSHDDSTMCDPPQYESAKARTEWHAGYLARCIATHGGDR